VAGLSGLPTCLSQDVTFLMHRLACFIGPFVLLAIFGSISRTRSWCRSSYDLIFKRSCGRDGAQTIYMDSCREGAEAERIQPLLAKARLSRRKQIIAEHFEVLPDDDDRTPRYNIAPTQPVLVIRQHPKEPRRELSLVRWGLIPSRQPG
jgi:hypothetical protein